MFHNAINSKKQGDIGLGVAISWFTIEGYTVCVPLTDSQDYDLIVDNGDLKRVQVKTTSVLLKSGSYQVQLYTTGGNRSWTGIAKNFNPETVDLVFVLTERGDKYLIPSKAITTKKYIVVGKKYSEYKIGAAVKLESHTSLES